MGNPITEELLKRDGRPVVAIVGGGCTGIAAAISLCEKDVANVVLIEKAEQLGGGSLCTNVQSRSGVTYQVGACVTNFSCPTFQELSSAISGVSIPVQTISTDFSVMDTKQKILLSRINGEVLCDRSIGNSKYASQQFQRILDISKQDLLQRNLTNISAESYLKKLCETENFYYSLPLPRLRMDADELARFWISHGILGDAPSRKFSMDGIGRYSKDFKRALRDHHVDVKLATNVSKLTRSNGVSTLHLVDAGCNETELIADYVILACHASEALRIIQNPTQAEMQALSMFTMKRNRIVIHSDAHLMGHNRKKWGAFNFVSSEHLNSDEAVDVVTYYCNRLAKLPDDMPDVFVSVNPIIEPDTNKILAESTETKDATPGYKKREADRKLQLISGNNDRIWYTGSYTVMQESNGSGWSTGKKCAEDVAEAIETNFSFSNEENIILPESEGIFGGCVSIFSTGACATIR